MGFSDRLDFTFVMDTFTKEGVPWLLPLTGKIGMPPVKRFRITSGKQPEICLFFRCCWRLMFGYAQSLRSDHHFYPSTPHSLTKPAGYSSPTCRFALTNLQWEL